MKYFTSLILILTNYLCFGQTWSEIPNMEQNVLSIYRSGNNLIAGLESGCEYTNDGGITWNVSTGLSNRANSFDASVNQLFVASNETVYHSTDNGVSWTGGSVIQTFTDVNTIFVNETRLIAGLDGRGIWISPDFGSNWQEATSSNQGPNSEILRLGDLLFASYQNGGNLQFSSNEGDSWSEPIGEGIRIQSSWPDISSMSTIGDSVLIVGTKNFGIFTVEDGVFFSSDQGDSWEKRVNGLADSTITALTTVNGIVFAGTETEGVFYSTNFGDNWEPLNDGLSAITINDFFFEGPILYAATSNGIFSNELCFLLSSTTMIDQVSCDSFTLNDLTYNESGLFSQVLTNRFNCDSILNINLTVNQSTEASLTEIGCNDFNLNGQLYTSSGTFTQQLINSVGCDSTITLNLTINELDTSVLVTEDSLKVNLSGVSYQWVSCDNNFEIIQNETNQTFITDIPGEYAAIVDNGVCSDTTNCFTYSVVTGLISNEFDNNLVVFPNPTKGNLKIDVGYIEGQIDLILRNLAGELIRTSSFRDQKLLEIDIKEPNGIYILEVNANKRKAVIRILKE